MVLARADRRRFAPSVRAPREARAFVRGALAAWGFAGGLAEDAELCTGELVTNAVLHARSDVEVLVEVREDGRVRICVTDGSPEPPVVPPRPRDDLRLAARGTGGRGLHLVDALAVAWGVELGPASKTVWVDLDPARA